MKKALAKLEKQGKPLPWATRQQLKRAPRPVLASLGPVAGRAILAFDDSSTEPASADRVCPERREVPPHRATRVISRAERRQRAGIHDDEHTNELYYQPFRSCR